MDQLLFTQDTRAASLEIEAHGGRVTQILGPHVLVANLPPQLETSALKSVTLKPAVKLNEEEVSLVSAWQAFQDKPPEKQKPMSWDTPGFEAP
jgi:hypothetical protein